MYDNEKIRLWAKGRLFELANGIGDKDAVSVLTDLLSLIGCNSEESTNEDLEKEFDKYIKENGLDGFDTIEEAKCLAKHFASWQKNRLMKTSIEEVVFDANEDLEELPVVDVSHFNVHPLDKVEVLIIKKDSV